MARKNRKRGRNRQSRQPSVEAASCGAADSSVEKAEAVSDIDVTVDDVATESEPTCEFIETDVVSNQETKPAKGRRRFPAIKTDKTQSDVKAYADIGAAIAEPDPTAQRLCESVENQIEDVAQAVKQVTIDMPSSELSLSDESPTGISSVDDADKQEATAEIQCDIVDAVSQVHEVVADETDDVVSEASVSNQRISDLITANTAVLQQVVEQITSLRQGEVRAAAVDQNEDSQCDEDRGEDLFAEMLQLSEQVEDLNRQLDAAQLTEADLRQQLDEMWSKNDRLVSELDSDRAASDRSHLALPESPQGCEVMTWEQRKELMLKQMEEDTFDADAFVESMQAETAVEVVGDITDLSPAEYVSQVNGALTQVFHELGKRDEEIVELRERLEEGDSTPRNAIENGTAAIEDLVDVDALIRDERERLQSQQREWEDRFRETEIAASLERAKLSRERRELGRQNADLEEQLIHFRRESEVNQKAGSKGSRRWLAMLGLSED